MPLAREQRLALATAGAATLGALVTATSLLWLQRNGLSSYLVLLPILALVGLTYWLYRMRVAAGHRRMDGLRRMHLSTIEALTVAIDAKDPHSRGHVRKVQGYAMEIARLMRLPRRDMDALRTAALLHDIGKLAIPDHLLNKPGKLSEREMQKIRAHPSVAAEILSNVVFPYPVLPIIRHHHERWDGTGYPDGLRGEAIPLGARILAVADTFEALTSDRVYRARKPPEEACALIESCAGLQFDPLLVGLLRDNLQEIRRAGDRSLHLPASAPLTDGSGCDAAAALRPWGGALWMSPDPGTTGACGAPGVGPAAETDDGSDWMTPTGIGSANDAPAGMTPADPAPAGATIEGSGLPAATGSWGTTALRDITSAHREVYALYEIAQTFGSSLRLAEVLELVVARIGQLVPYHTCLIYLVEDGSDTLSARFVSGANSSVLYGRAMKLGEGISGWAAAQQSARFSDSPALDLAGAEVDAGEYSTVAAFPLCHDNRTLGVITLYFMKGVPCQDDHIRMMDIIAKLAAGAVLNSTVFAETQESALTDELTGLPNSRYLRQVFQQEAIRSQQAGQPLAFLEMDLDNFKAINDRFGHRVGDTYLMEVSRVLKSLLRGRDILVRLSGDEFAAVLPKTGFAAAALLSERLQRAVDLFSLRLEERQAARAGLSIGIALYPQDGESFEDLLMRADYNMYQNKSARKNARLETAANIIPFPIKVPGGKG